MGKRNLDESKEATKGKKGGVKENEATPVEKALSAYWFFLGIEKDQVMAENPSCKVVCSFYPRPHKKVLCMCSFPCSQRKWHIF